MAFVFDSPLYFLDSGLWVEGFGEISVHDSSDVDVDVDGDGDGASNASFDVESSRKPLPGYSFCVYRKANPKVRYTPNNRGRILHKIPLFRGGGKCRAMHMPDAAAVISKNKLPASVSFFEIVMSTGEDIYVFGSLNDIRRIEWIHAINGCLLASPVKPVMGSPSRSPNSPNEARSPPLRVSSGIHTINGRHQRRRSSKGNNDDNGDDDDDISNGRSPKKSVLTKQENYIPVHLLKQPVERNHFSSLIACCSFNRDSKVFGLVKIDAFIRFFQLCLGYPFVIISAAVTSSSESLWFLKSVYVIWLMNLIIYVGPIILVVFVLSQFLSNFAQRLTIGLYLLFYLLPVGYVSFTKIVKSRSSKVVDDGTFNFKPASSIKFTADNISTIVGILFEWVQHVLYVLPTGIVSGDQVTKLQDYPPYLPFEIYFWMAVGSTFLCGFILIFNSLLRGKALYQFRESSWIWILLYNVGSPMYMTIVTILFMSLYCDLTTTPPVLVQSPDLVCYSPKHLVIATVGLVTLAVYIVHNTLLPSGTFKESMGGTSLDIMFVPAYLQAHFLFKAIFCGVYVFYYSDNLIRAVVLTAINVILLCLNAHMKPCSVESINVFRNTIFVHATFSGIQSLNYLSWPISADTKNLVVSSLITNCVFTTIVMYLFYFVNRKSTEYTVATTFLDLEWQLTNGGSIHSRALEPLISLTMSQNKADLEIAKKYIPQLVRLVSYPNVRVQFQSSWGLANMSLIDDDARLRIFKEGGFRTLYEWYTDMDNIGQLEALATMANLTLSEDVAYDMVKTFKCVPFFINITSSNKLKHSQFATIALANIARRESFRELIYNHGGLPVLVGCVLAHNIEKRRFGCLSCANMALSPREEIVEIFQSQAMVDRIVHLAKGIDIGTQREITALIRHLSCHPSICELLAKNKDIVPLMRHTKYSVYPDVQTWADEILVRMVDHQMSTIRSSQQLDSHLLKKITPLQGCVEWSTWGSKLETIFSPLFSRVPKLDAELYTTAQFNEPAKIQLDVGVPRYTLKTYRDNISFTILERPLHGKLPAYVPPSHEVIYTPNQGFVGSDSFTFKLNLGDSSSNPATCHITVLDPEGDPVEANDAQQPQPTSSNSNSRRSSSAAAGRFSDVDFVNIYPRSTKVIDESKARNDRNGQ